MGDNACGFEPAGHLVLVLPRSVAHQSAGGIALPDEHVERLEMAQIFARVIDIGPNAWFDEEHPRAAVGDEVMIAKFVGQLFTGGDGKRYRVINDKDIIGIVTSQKVKA